ncbi:MAG: hypothetical protein KDA47_21895 [Planctomycetales bacterium]|nr:hypothetical protein [Planctomycetales bacterium]
MSTIIDDLAAAASEGARPVTKWAAIAGKWTFSGADAKYLAPASTKAMAPLGIAIGSRPFRDGVIETTIRLSRNENTSAGIVFGFRALDQHYLFAQLGGWSSAYALGEYRPGIGWKPVAQAGNLENLPVGQDIQMAVQVFGQTVEMIVDDVPVLNAVLSRPVQGTGAGLYAYYDGSIEFENTRISSIPARIFVIMPFAEPFDTLYREVIKPVAAELDFEINRVDEISGPGIILEDIQRQIEESHAVVAEISTHNPNVFYELGYAHALRKPAILLVRREDGGNMPFDIRGYRAIFYDDNIGGKRVVERNLRQHLLAVRGRE